MITETSKEIIREWKTKHALAMKQGDFSKANAIKSKLEALGEPGDFESTFDPEQLK